MSSAAVPDAEELRKLISQFVGKPVTLKAPAGPPKPNSAPQLQALYCADDGTPCAVASLDFLFAAYLGAALAMMPPGAAQDAAKTGKMSELLMDCTKEVLNVSAQLMNKPGRQHVALNRVVSGLQGLPPEIRAKMATARFQKEYDLEIAGYGRGRVVFRAA